MNSKLTTNSTVAATRDQVSSDLAGEAVILGLSRGIYYGLDPVGSRIWQLVQEPRRVSEVRDAILAEYDVAPEVCEADLLDLFDKLLAEGLIEVRDRDVSG